MMVKNKVMIFGIICINFLFLNLIILSTGNIFSLKGTEKEFWVQDTWKSYNDVDDDEDGQIDFQEDDWDEGIYKITTELIINSPNFNVYIDTLLSYNLNTIQNEINELELKIITTINIFGTIPDINHDNKVSLVITDIRDHNYYYGSEVFVQGFFWPIQSLSKGTGIQAYSSYEDILYIDVYAINSYNMAEVVIHEIQHLIQFDLHRNQDLWLDEGLSVYNQFVNNYLNDPNQYVNSYFADSNVSLTYFENRLESYGLSFLFVKYLIDKYQLNIQSLISNNNIGMLAIVSSLQQTSSIVTSSASLFNNFSMALLVNSNDFFDFSIETYNKKIQSSSVQIGQLIQSKVKAWGFTSYSIPTLTQSLKLTFSNALLDSSNQAASYWINILITNTTDHQFYSKFIDPLSGRGETIFPMQSITNGQLYMTITAFSGISSGSIGSEPPLNLFQIKLENHKGKFLFPGYRHFYESNMLITSIQVFDSEETEWTESNTEIAKYFIKKTDTNEIINQGDLMFTSSGWIVNNIDTTEYSKNQEYQIDYTFYNGTTTILFSSSKFKLQDNIVNIINLETIQLIILFGTSFFITFIIIVKLRQRIRKKNRSESTPKLTKLPQLFLDENDKKVQFKIKRRGKKY